MVVFNKMLAEKLKDMGFRCKEADNHKRKGERVFLFPDNQEEKQGFTFEEAFEHCFTQLKKERWEARN